MSIWADCAVACPTCHAATTMRVASGVHGSRVPEVRAAVLARMFHRATCGGCGAVLAVDRTFLYTDLERGHWVLVIAADQVSEWRRWERAVQDSVTRGFALGSPLAEAATPRLVRVVIGTEGLREKLVLWQHGLDDGLVECAKLRLIAGQPALAAPGAALVVDAVTADGGIAVDWWPAPAGPPARRLLLTVNDLAACDRDGAALRARFPELFAGGLVGLIRTGIFG